MPLMCGTSQLPVPLHKQALSSPDEEWLKVRVNRTEYETKKQEIWPWAESVQISGKQDRGRLLDEAAKTTASGTYVYTSLYSTEERSNRTPHVEVLSTDYWWENETFSLKYETVYRYL